MQGVLQQPVDGIALLGDVDDRADAADDLAVGAEHRPGADREPVIVAVLGAYAELMIEPALAVLQQHVERGAEAVAVVGMQARQPVARRAVHDARRKAELDGDVGNGDDAVARHVPVPDRIARARQRQRLALEIGEEALAIGPAGKGVLHHREADEENDEHEAAAERRLDDVVVELARHRQPRPEQPDEDQRPGRHEQDGAVVAVEAEIGDEHDADRAGQREGETGDAGGDRRIVDRHAEEEREAEHPGERRVGEVCMPAVEVEIGEEEDDEARRQEHLGSCPPYALVTRCYGDELGEEAEVDADIAEHRPGERCRRRQHGGALHHEEDGEEHGEKAGDAEHDAAIEREGVDRVLVGIRRPEVDLRQVGGRQLRDEGHDRSGVERDAEDVRLLARLAVEGKALAWGDRDDALCPEVRPEQPRLHEAEMRGDDQAVDLLFRNVGEREDGPVALMGLGGRADLDAAHDAVRAGRGGYLEGFAPARIDFRGGGEVERRVVTGDLHRLDGEGPAGEEADKQHRRQENEGEQPAGGVRLRHGGRRH